MPTQKHIVIDARIRLSSTGRYVDRLLEHLQDIDHVNRYSILVQPDDTWQPKSENFSRIDCRYQQFSFNPVEQFGFASQLGRLKADLVHFPMNQQPLLYFGRTITSVMDLTMLRYSRPGKSPLPVFWLKLAGYRFLFWYSTRKSRALLAISEYVRQDLARHYPFTAGKTVVTLCASEPPLTDTPVQPETAKTPYILYVGSAFPHKNLDRLVDAFGKLKQSQPDLQLFLAGKKEFYYEQLDAIIARKHLSDSIHTMGYVSDAELKWLYENASTYVFPSLSEGFGLPGLEAMAHGCPVVSSNSTCLPEVYGEAAHYFDPNDTNDMASKIAEVIKDEKLRAELIDLGYKQTQKYSWRKMAEQTFAAYQKILGA